MKRTIWNTLTILVITAALPAVLHAQITVESPDGTVISQNANGSYDLPSKQSTGLQDQIEQLLVQGTGDGKHIIVVLDSVRADEKALADFTSSLRSSKARIRQDGVRIFAGDNKEATKYGAGADDKVIIVATDSVAKQP